jgi:hypothetical protein
MTSSSEGLAVAVAVVTAGLLNPIKLPGETGTAFVVVVDLLMGCTTAILSFVVAGMSQAAANPSAAQASRA